jgi:predicted CXXCH cytochrome family protein
MFRGDVHFQKGIGCAGCHGGDAATEDMDAAMSKTAGFLGVPSGDNISVMCSRCHGDGSVMKQLGSALPVDQVASLQNSVHGKSSLKGGERIAQCTICHGAHGVFSVTDKRSRVHPLHVVSTCGSCHSNASYMRSYNPSLPVDQAEKYRASTHGELNGKGDAKAATCVSCHGSHEVLPASDVRSSVYATNLPGTCSVCHSDPVYMGGYSIPTDQYGLFAASVHGVALMEKHDLAAPACNDCHGNHAATPPGVESISKVCGTCHAINAELFTASRHKRAFDDLGLPECETCHGNHGILNATNDLLGVNADAACVRCHEEGEALGGFAFAKTIRFLVDSLDTAYARSIRLVEEAEQKGMEVTEPRFRLRDVRQARFQARTIIHSFEEDTCRAVLSDGIRTAGTVAESARSAIDEYYFRRAGLGFATLVITILGISLYSYIRRLERRQQQAPRSDPGSRA